jgi:hypothetical protein
VRGEKGEGRREGEEKGEGRREKGEGRREKVSGVKWVQAGMRVAGINDKANGYLLPAMS